MGDIPKRTARKRMADPSWDMKDDIKRRNWLDKEILALLNLIQKHNLLDHSPTDSQLGETLSEPMNKLGYNRTPHQIKLKIKSLRNNYLQCRKGINDVLKKTVYFDILDALYCNADLRNSDSEEEMILQPEEASNIWTESEVKRMLTIIKQTDLAHELSVGVFPMKALRQIYKSLQNYRIFKSIDLIRICLTGLRDTYVKYKKSLVSGRTDEECPYFEQLDSLWKRDFAIGHFHMLNEREEFWSEEETVVLLETIKESDLVEETRQYCSENTAYKIQEALRDSGYSRTTNQIIKKLQNLKQNYVLVKQFSNLDEAIDKFPFYHRYESVYGSTDGLQQKHFKEIVEKSNRQLDLEKEELEDSPEKTDCEETIVLEKKKHVRGYQWIEEETLALLDLIKEMHMEQVFSGRMTAESVAKLIKPLEKRGFFRSVDQVKIKLRGLRQQYYRCVRLGCTPKALLECPFFEKMHAFYTNEHLKSLPMVRKPLLAKKKDALMQIIVDEKDKTYSNDRSLSNLTSDMNNEMIIEYSNELWEPIETIVDDEDVRKRDDEDKLSDMSFEEVHSSDMEEIEDKNFVHDDDSHNNTSNNTMDHFYVSSEYLGVSREKENRLSHTGSKLKSSSNDRFVISQSTPLSEHLIDNDDVQENDSQIHTSAVHQEYNGEEFLDCGSPKNGLLFHILKHEELLQHQHHTWLEKQFEIQRKHDCEQRAELLKELRELRKAITSTVFA